jgi:hypothetical protein
MHLLVLRGFTVERPHRRHTRSPQPPAYQKKSWARFLASRYKSMPRTMLRYAIERFPERERQAYLRGTI